MNHHDRAAPAPATPPAPGLALLRIRGLSVGHPDQPPLVRDWHADIGPGLALLAGDTGSGKSSVLRVLAGDAPALAGRLGLLWTRGSGGEAEAAGESFLAADAPAWRRQVFFVDPGTEAFHPLTVRACVARLHAGDAHADGARWQALAQAFGLGPHLDKSLFMLSTGSRRKVWLASALASGRALVLLDEPTAALDAASIHALHEALADAARDARRLVLVASGEAWPGLPWRLRASLPLLPAAAGAQA